MTLPSMARSITTIERYIQERQSHIPEASGTLTEILQYIALAGKMIASHTNRAGLADILGTTGDTNVQGEKVQKLDIYSHDVLYKIIAPSGKLAALVSEEMEDVIQIDENAKYILSVDPLDGSSNIDMNVSVGTVFAISRRTSVGHPVSMEEILRPGKDVVAAGYIVYGSSSMFVYSAGDGVHGFTLDPAVGEFLLSHPDIRLPEKPKYYSANLARQTRWSKGVQAFCRWLNTEEASARELSLRYVGSMVADVHRTLLSGGLFFYPGDLGTPTGKLRLLYEAIPMAFLMEQAGGAASDGLRRILDIEPDHIHQRVPIFLGNQYMVEKVAELIQANDD